MDKIVEKIVEVPKEFIKEKIVLDNTKVRELENDKFLLEESNKLLRESIDEWKLKYKELENKPAKTIDRIVEVPVQMIKIDETRIKELETINKQV